MFVFKNKTAYELRISDKSTDVCSSDLDRLNLERSKGQQCEQAGFDPVLSDFLLRAAAGEYEDRRRDWDDAACIASPPCQRSEAHRVGKACVSTCRSRWSTYH